MGDVLVSVEKGDGLAVLTLLWLLPLLLALGPAQTPLALFLGSVDQGGYFLPLRPLGRPGLLHLDRLHQPDRRRLVAAHHLHAQRDRHQLGHRDQRNGQDDHRNQDLDQREAAFVSRFQSLSAPSQTS